MYLNKRRLALVYLHSLLVQLPMKCGSTNGTGRHGSNLPTHFPNRKMFKIKISENTVCLPKRFLSQIIPITGEVSNQPRFVPAQYLFRVNTIR